jgi:glycolate oxidase iron-sulfur subunit
VRPEDSARVLDRHLDEIADADLDMIAVVNPGCYRQLQQGVKRRRLRTRVLHLAELLGGENDAPTPATRADRSAR